MWQILAGNVVKVENFAANRIDYATSSIHVGTSLDRSVGRQPH